MADQAQQGINPEVGVTGESPAPEVPEVSEETQTQTPETVEETTVEGDGEVETSEESPASPKHATAEDRIKYLWKLNKEREEEIERLRTQLEQSTQPGETVPTEKPRFDDYESIEEYQEALVQYEVSRRIQELEQKQREFQLQEQQRKAWQPFLDKAMKLDPGEFPEMEKAIVGEGVTYDDIMREFVRTSDVGPQMAYHFYKNPDLADRIARMPVASRVQALVELQSELVRSKEPRTTTNAPEPINPLGATGGETTKDPDKMTMEEWLEWRRKQPDLRR